MLGGGIGSGLDATAKKGRKRRRKKKKKICLFGQRRCRDKRCHGCCADADCGGNVCDSGTCSDCPRNERICRGGCIPEDACCADADCAGGRVCVDGTCECGPDRRLCEGVCIAADACCGTDCPVDTCTPDTCNGCCDGNTCREGEGQNFCGRNGVACAQCGRDGFCNAGACECQSGTKVCPNGDCIPQDGCCGEADCPTCQTCEDQQCVPLCPSGCCHDETCEPGNTLEFCGKSGEICVTCPAEATCVENPTTSFCLCAGSGFDQCGRACCGADEHCCSDEFGQPTHCCPNAMTCCPPGAPNGCCTSAEQCLVLGAEGCVAAATSSARRAARRERSSRSASARRRARRS